LDFGVFNFIGGSRADEFREKRENDKLWYAFTFSYQILEGYWQSYLIIEELYRPEISYTSVGSTQEYVNVAVMKGSPSMWIRKEF